MDADFWTEIYKYRDQLLDLLSLTESDSDSEYVPSSESSGSETEDDTIIEDTSHLDPANIIVAG